MVFAFSRRLIFQSLRSKARVLFSDKNLLLTNTAVTLSLSATGDILQQRYEITQRRQTHWDGDRTRNILCASVAVCPAVHYWYLYLDHFLPGRSLHIILKKVFVDQMIMSPMCILSFLGITGYLEGLSAKKISDDLQTKGVALFKAEWIVWPPAQIFQFAFLPTKYRVLYDNCVCLCVDCYYYFVKYSRGWKGNSDHEDLSANMTCAHETVRRRNDKRLYITHAFFL
ncbi:hypothetical protein CAPTEDRAFT_148624 [Capitella teleta]|uniref:Mpv17-like protein 2 n=1 Tax=Capitella teleta TaxID=283909 RepID=R7UFJ5_CAPTE|nr:hypothetical protein CAPTEDRAFT_148624 [Capitella teleta]|eukprot:ELU02037.1 hypothetical protein CAPTEDRAFT_148624 [Capitella teleta]